MSGLLVGLLLLSSSFERDVVAAGGDAAPSLLAGIPRRAILVVYCPSLERLVGAWESVGPLRDVDDRVIGRVFGRLEAVRSSSLAAWTARLGLTTNDLLEILPGEFMIGWMPRMSPTDPAFAAGEWVLVGRLGPDGEAAVRRLWRQAMSRAAPGSRTTRRQIAGIAVEQVVWQEMSKTEFSDPKPPRIDKRRGGELPDRIKRGDGFAEMVKVKQHAMTMGVGKGLVFFAPSSAERLEPWIPGGSGRYRTSRPSEQLRALMSEVESGSETVLALQAKPPAWVPPVEPEGGSRFGSDPLYVLLSQARSLELVVARKDDRFRLDARTTVLPPPGWLARLLGALGDGASLAAVEDATAEFALRADLPRLWMTIRDVLTEGWPAVRVVVDTLLAPLGGTRGEGAAQLAATLGTDARIFVFAPEGKDSKGASWAMIFAVRDPERFGAYEPALRQLIQTFAPGLVDYEITAAGELKERVHATTGSVSAMAKSLHMGRSPSHLALAGSRASLEKALRYSGRRSTAEPDGARNAADALSRRGFPSSALTAPSPAGRSSMVFYYEAVSGPKLDRGARRVIRGPSEMLELISPPRDGKSDEKEPVSAAPADPDGSAARPMARLVGALIVESEKQVRLRIDLQAAEDLVGAAKNRSRPRVLRKPTMQE